MTFSFYSSLKSVPPDLVAVARLARMSWWERFFRLDLSFAAHRIALEQHDVHGRRLVLPDGERGVCFG
jgi:ABC-type anion transport system duplicated permease subunit